MQQLPEEQGPPKCDAQIQTGVDRFVKQAKEAFYVFLNDPRCEDLKKAVAARYPFWEDENGFERIMLATTEELDLVLDRLELTQCFLLHLQDGLEREKIDRTDKDVTGSFQRMLKVLTLTLDMMDDEPSSDESESEEEEGEKETKKKINRGWMN